MQMRRSSRMTLTINQPTLHPSFLCPINVLQRRDCFMSLSSVLLLLLLDEDDG